MKAMILAAGEGTRLRPLTLSLPKPMIPMVNTPLLVRTIQLLASQGITEIAVNLYHQAAMIESKLGDGSVLGVRLYYSAEPDLLGTAGGVKAMESFLDEPFLVLYGDNLYQAEFRPLFDFHRANGALVTIATFEATNPSACGLVVADADGRVQRFQEKPPPEEVFTNCANAGVYVLDPTIHDYIDGGTASDFGKDVFPRILLEAPGRMYARPLNGYLRDTGTVESYRQANRDLLEGRVGGLAPESGVASSAQIAPDARLSGRNVIGANVSVGSSTVISQSILWDNVIVEERCRINGAIIGRGVYVGAGSTILEGAIIADGARVLPGAVVPASARISPGETVGPAD